jgi:hypothetical protein
VVTVTVVVTVTGLLLLTVRVVVTVLVLVVVTGIVTVVVAVAVLVVVTGTVVVTDCVVVFVVVTGTVVVVVVVTGTVVVLVVVTGTVVVLVVVTGTVVVLVVVTGTVVVSVVVTGTVTVVFPADVRQAPPERHDDCGVACALASTSIGPTITALSAAQPPKIARSCLFRGINVIPLAFPRTRYADIYLGQVPDFSRRCMSVSSQLEAIVARIDLAKRRMTHRFTGRAEK